MIKQTAIGLSRHISSKSSYDCGPFTLSPTINTYVHNEAIKREYYRIARATGFVFSAIFQRLEKP